jgi:hypothetical protein
VKKIEKGVDISGLTTSFHSKPALQKPVYALKDGVETKYDSIAKAAQALGLLAPNVSQAVNGKTSHCGGYKFKFGGVTQSVA